ncbi:WD40 repeat domain-containing protein [Anaerolinea thermophila]|uniref:Uncharacterized protein n=1 Tax=Anaerolinea thermophila (strain DSM 14523 / JCM 11388 / NBRC 100420 / UNI-1) TaxID=926569 RepID=E8N5G4_ANATU|nr:hypothetical protein [Anaerolinea thermophila]BAJ63678.1 hypothetical protein ANT_16520 [Anaerolinea thermophila UNI-1]
MVTSEDFSVSDLRALLEENIDIFSSDQIHYLVQAGCILLLEEKATEEAIQTLYQISENGSAEISNFATEALKRLASQENEPAVDALYQLALKENQQGLRQWLLAKPYIPQHLELKVLLEFLVEENPQQIDRLPALTQAFFQFYSLELQNTLLLHTKKTPFERWIHLLIIIQNLSDSDIFEIVNQFNTLSEIERKALTDALIRKAKEGSSVAFDTLAMLHIHYDLPEIVEFLQREEYLPLELPLRALYLFFTNQIEEYLQSDYEFSSLLDTYQRASKSLRHRILQQARRIGQVSWLQRLGSEKGEVRFLADLSDHEWEETLSHLSQAERYEDLWRLAQHASPYWSVVILTLLQRKEWHPLPPPEHEAYVELCALAQPCTEALPKPALVNTLYSPERLISSLAFDVSGKYLAAGSSGQTIFVWNLPEGKMLIPAPAAPYPNHRAVLFSPDGEFLVSAGGDHRLRVFRMTTQSVVKTFEGHRGQIRSIHFSPDGKILYSAGFDGSVRAWRFPMGTELYQSSFPEKEIFAILPFAEGRLLAVAGYSPNIRILSLPDLKQVHSIPGCAEGNFFLAGHFSSDFVIAGGKDRILRTWNGKTGSFLWQFGPLASPPVGMFLHPDGEHLLYGTRSGTLGFIRVSNPTAATQVLIQEDTFSSLALSPDGAWIAGVNDAGIIHLWDNTLYLWTRFVHRPGSTLPIQDLEDRMNRGRVPRSELPWAKFILAFWKWISRFDVEVEAPQLISAGEFDIEI